MAVQVDDAVAVLDDVSLDDFTQGDEATDEVDIALDPAEFDLEVVDDAGVSIEAANVTLEGDGDEDIEPVIYDDVEVIPEAEGSVDEASKISQTAEAISATPTYGGVFEVYNTYFNWYPYNMAMENMAYDLYMENSADWVNWVRSGYMRANLIKLFIQQGFAISGLVPNTVYSLRIFYGGTINGQFVTGPAVLLSPIRTGAVAAPAINKVRLKAVKVKRHRVRHPGYYNYVGGMLFWHKAYTETYYTCKLKVIVKMKRRPGTNGIWITVDGQSKYVKGNKKRYTATFTPTINYFAKKPKGGRYKYTVTVRSGQDPNWGGYSPAWSRTRRLR